MSVFTRLFTGATLALTATVAWAEVDDATIKESYHEKAAVAQFLRWFQFYENDAVGIANQRDLLTEDFSVTSPSGRAEGRDQYEAAVQNLPSEWQNAHRVQQVLVERQDDGALHLKAEVVFSNIGIAADGAASAQRLNYDARLVYDDSVLPRFSGMTISSVEGVAIDAFEDSYAENRLRSLVAYWIALVEHPGRDAEPFREILAPDPDIKFSEDGPTYRSYEDLAAWVAGPVSSLPATRHVIGPISYSLLDDGRFEMMVDFDWQGIRPDGKRMTAKTRHTWRVVDTPSERFARVQSIRVELLEPFALAD